MRYQIHFEQELPAEVLRRLLHEDYGISPDTIHVGRIEARAVEGAAADGNVRVVHALEPITGEPDLAVVPPPEWARDW
ncbi:hypothetical protein ACLQ3A_11520 [Micromonospora zamorensis]|uniref:hypothetical protein n=1 Tax=Micromonospora zamorensis TaxID=709883 RepID=UPI003CF86952